VFSKKNLLSRQEIIFLTSQKISPSQGKYFGLIYSPSEVALKFGVIISKKISSKAVTRNKIKRLLYLAIKNKFFFNKGLFLFLAKKNSADGNLDDFEKEVAGFKNKLPK